MPTTPQAFVYIFIPADKLDRQQRLINKLATLNNVTLVKLRFITADPQISDRRIRTTGCQYRYDKNAAHYAAAFLYSFE
jgi:hypothetical protein